MNAGFSAVEVMVLMLPVNDLDELREELLEEVRCRRRDVIDEEEGM